jgi:hypothetical protein
MRHSSRVSYFLDYISMANSPPFCDIACTLLHFIIILKSDIISLPPDQGLRASGPGVPYREARLCLPRRTFLVSFKPKSTLNGMKQVQSPRLLGWCINCRVILIQSEYASQSQRIRSRLLVAIEWPP